MLATLLIWGKLLETVMLVCFGLSWPISILKSLRTKFVRGKSPAFMTLVIVGYLAGGAAKLFRAAHETTWPEFVTALYFFNALLVVIDLGLYMRYRHNVEPVTRQVAQDIAAELSSRSRDA
jgi:hypothetical protein